MNIKRKLSADLVKVPVLNGIATVIRMITGLVSVKVVASVIGPAGIALVGQLNNFTQILLSLSNGGIISGVTKYVSEYSEDRAKYTAFISAATRITLVLSAILSVVLFALAGLFSGQILKSPDYWLVFIIFGLTIFMFAANTLLVAVLNGFREYRKFVIVNITGSIVGLLFSVVLALLYGVKGALIASVTFQSVVFFLSLYLLRGSPWLKKEVFFGAFQKDIALKLGAFSLMALVSAITVPGAQLLIRGFITEQVSAVDAGLWEGINRISGMYLMVVTTSLGVYYLPRIAQLKSDLELRQEITKVYKLVIPFLIISTTAIYLFRFLIIRILFTHEFQAMEKLFLTQLSADFLKISGWVLGYVLLAKAMTREYIYLEIQNFVLLVGLNYFLIGKYGTIGATTAHALVYLLYLVVILILLRKKLFAKTLNTTQ